LDFSSHLFNWQATEDHGTSLLKMATHALSVYLITPSSIIQTETPFQAHKLQEAITMDVFVNSQQQKSSFN